MPSLKPDQRFVRLCLLKVGEQFTIPSLAEVIGTMTVIRSSDCTVQAHGPHRDYPDSDWGTSNRPFAPSSMVLPLGTSVEVRENSEGRALIVGTDHFNKRGRRAKHEVEFPQKGQFKIKELAAELGLEYATVMNAFNKQRNLFKQVGTVPNGGRGKPLLIWERK
jgi:hypothetical protein